MLLCRGSGWPVAFSQARSCSYPGQATPHDEAHNAFMTLPPYSKAREDEVHLHEPG